MPQQVLIITFIEPCSSDYAIKVDNAHGLVCDGFRSGGMNQWRLGRLLFQALHLASEKVKNGYILLPPHVRCRDRENEEKRIISRLLKLEMMGFPD